MARVFLIQLSEHGEVARHVTLMSDSCTTRDHRDKTDSPLQSTWNAQTIPHHSSCLWLLSHTAWCEVHTQLQGTSTEGGHLEQVCQA